VKLKKWVLDLLEKSVEGGQLSLLMETLTKSLTVVLGGEIAINILSRHYFFMAFNMVLVSLLVGFTAGKEFQRNKIIEYQKLKMERDKAYTEGLAKIVAYAVGLTMMVDRGIRPDTSDFRKMVHDFGIQVDCELTGGPPDIYGLHPDAKPN
jgi:hypothetical protein